MEVWWRYDKATIFTQMLSGKSHIQARVKPPASRYRNKKQRQEGVDEAFLQILKECAHVFWEYSDQGHKSRKSL